MNCEFCGLENVSGNDLRYHNICFKRAIEAMLKLSNILNTPSPPPESTFNFYDEPKFMVIMNPEATMQSRPRRILDTEKQAIFVSKKLANEAGEKFLVLKIIGEAKPRN